MKNNKSKLSIRGHLQKIWKQVPPDYYERGVATNKLQSYWHNQKFRTFKLLVSKNFYQKILDVGCASGYMANRISHLFPRSEVFAIDSYPEAIKFGRRNYPQIKFSVADAHKLPFKANFFDLVVCYETIEHVLDPIAVLQQIKRVMKEDGSAIIVMDSGNLLFRLVWFFWERTRGKVWRGAHLHPFKHSSLEKTIQKAGFKIVNKHFSHFGMEVSFTLRK